jgi:hypothetical protein
VRGRLGPGRPGSGSGTMWHADVPHVPVQVGRLSPFLLGVGLERRDEAAEAFVMRFELECAAQGFEGFAGLLELELAFRHTR